MIVFMGWLAAPMMVAKRRRTATRRGGRAFRGMAGGPALGSLRMLDSKDKSAYAAAGVNIAAQDEGLRAIKQLARSTFTAGVLSEIGSFGGLFRPDLAGMTEPVLVASADGVGTKLTIAHGRRLLDGRARSCESLRQRHPGAGCAAALFFSTTSEPASSSRPR